MDYLPVQPLPGNESQRLSQRLSLDYPYDWCNSRMPAQLLINTAIERARFDDLCKLAFYFGIEALMNESTAKYGNERQSWPGRLSDMLDNIQYALDQHERDCTEALS